MAAFSRMFGHFFVSFAYARNNLAVGLIQSGVPCYYVGMNNVVQLAGETTEDHDGRVFVSVINDLDTVDG